MIEYDILNALTNPMYCYGNYKLIKTFFTEKSYNEKVEKLSFILFGILSTIFFIVVNIPIILLTFNIISIFLLSLNYAETLFKRILYTIFIYSIGIVIELSALSYLVFCQIITLIQIPLVENVDFTSVIGITFVRVLLMIIGYLIHKYFRVSKKNYPLPIEYYIGITTIMFGTLYLFVCSFDNIILSLDRIIISSVVLIVVNVTFMLIDEKIYSAIMLANEQKILLIEMESFRNQAEITSEASNTIKSLKHDIKDHISILNKLHKENKDTEFDEYITKIYGNLDNVNLSNTNNFIFDSIINYKLKKLESTDTEIKLNINILPTVNILAYDLTIILGNLLENSVTAILNSSDKKLVLRINQTMGNIIILIDNSYNGELIQEGEKYITTKKGNTSKGLGLLNVEKCLQNYDGELRVSHTDEIFSVSVIIPYK